MIILMLYRPPLPDTDDEDGIFTSEPGSHRPIHMAAHGLYQEVIVVVIFNLIMTLQSFFIALRIIMTFLIKVKQWDHTDNEIIAAAKKIAYLMAHLR